MSKEQIIITSAFVLIIVAVIFVLRTTSKKSLYESAWDSSEIQRGPVHPSELAPVLIDRIRKLEVIFAEVYPITHEDWLDGFKRDQNPEKEITTWEHLGSAYVQFLHSNDLDANARKEAFGLLLIRSSTPDFESRLSNLKYLTDNQARSLLDLYRAPPQPITIQNNEQGTAPRP